MLYSLVDEVWCSSELARQTLISHLPVDGRKIKVVNYGRDISFLEKNFLSRDEARQKLKLPSRALVMGVVSRFEKSKGIQELLDASISLMSENPNLHLVVIGGPSPQNADAALYDEKIHHQVRRTF